jgi:hypothetical protein
MAKKRSVTDGSTAAAKERAARQAAEDAHYSAELTRLEEMFAEMSMTRAGLANRSPTSPATTMQLIEVLDYMLEMVEIAITPPLPRTKTEAKKTPKAPTERRTPARKSGAAPKR